MASKFVFNPFTGTFDITTPPSVCPIVADWPIYRDDNGALRLAPMLTTSGGDCVTTIDGDFIYATDPYIVP
jgi:hypothetical protein